MSLTLKNIRAPPDHQGPSRPSGSLQAITLLVPHDGRHQLFIVVTDYATLQRPLNTLGCCDEREAASTCHANVLCPCGEEGVGSLIKLERIISNGALVCGRSEVETLLPKHSEVKAHLVTECRFLPSLPFLCRGGGGWVTDPAAQR